MLILQLRVPHGVREVQHQLRGANEFTKMVGKETNRREVRNKNRSGHMRLHHT